MRRKQQGLTLIELLLAVAITSLMMTGLIGLVNQSLQVEDNIREKNDLTQQTRFAMQRMVTAVQGTKKLLLPLADNPNTNWRENVREQTVPASPPEGSSTLATAVLAVTLDPSIDRDGDGWADANNDKDFLDINNNSVRDAGEPERIDEDLHLDNTNDDQPGIADIDDDGDGLVDEGDKDDDDEDGTKNEDLPNGIDDDADGAIDEDTHNDMNQDGEAGVLGVDDDLDGTIDEGDKEDDDEDGSQDEDWYDAVVYYLNGSNLIERLPSLTDTNDDSDVTGADISESIIAENVTLLRFERIPQGGGRVVLVDITLGLTSSSNENVILNTRVRVGGGL